MEIRDELVNEAVRYFVGPYENDEELRDYPEEIYISGLLFPKNSQQEAEDLEESPAGNSSGDDIGTPEENFNSKPWILQNSIGLRCSLRPDVNILPLEVSYAKYERNSNGNWRRNQIGPKNFQIDLNDKRKQIDIDDSNNESETRITWNVDTDKKVPPSYKILSVFLSNEMNQPEDIDDSGNERSYREKKVIKNQRIIFQPTLTVRSEKKDAFLATDVEKEDIILPPEEESLELLFRNKKIFAQGYNCAADWGDDKKKPSFVKTILVPIYDSKKIHFWSEGDDDRPCKIDIVKIDKANTPKEVRNLLEPMVYKYDRWISNVGRKIKSLEERYTSIANNNHGKCVNLLARIRDGLDLIEDKNHPEIFEAFKLANRAMLYQIARYDFAIRKSKGQKDLPKTPDVFSEDKYFWYPFQIAFLVMNIRGVADNESETGKKQRETVDLLWFPTGGGKTEAYLALAAFTMILRRLTGAHGGDEGLGVSVMMRYTLRLLTLQQFERASTLICALEIMRRREPNRLGREPFLIGLWVGYSLTPNSWQDSKNAIDKLVRGETPAGSPAQLNFCPWCGSNIKCDRYQNDYYFDDKKTKWTIIHCSNTGCDFYHRDKGDTQRALPVLTVDFDIYRRCPSLLIATVDKFARLAWKPETSSIFGIVNRKCPRCGFLNHSSDHPEGSHRGGGGVVENVNRLNGPDLIIQDELHLITGPLGTMVGLYETAVEYLCSLTRENGIRPKIVVSTATIRGVEDQVKKLYNRKRLETFPPPALDYGDSFFWWEENEGGRRYVGLSYSHRSMKFALGRIYASLLQRVFEISQSGNQNNVLDPYWTVVGYFNSSRELGGAIRLVEDDVKSNIRKMVSLIDSHSQFQERTFSGPDELTGRRTGAEIKELRKRLESDINSRDSIDILLATNMISVGIDVNRLGLMVVDGQTKNISEYIQATGRIGRRPEVPGLVFTLYNPYKPRDLSHFENFIGTHLTLQKSVEPAGLTPFSDKSMERGIHAVLISLIRLVVDNLSQNEDADSFQTGNQRISRLHGAIVSRYHSVQDLDRSSPDYDLASKILNQFQDNWVQFIEKCHRENDLVYYIDDSKYVPYDNVPKKEKVLMTDYAEKESKRKEKGFPKETPGSLRDVESEAKLFYV